MNAAEQKTKLIEAGYTYEDKKGYMFRHRWYDQNGKLVCRDDSFDFATQNAYQHYLDNQAQETAAPVADEVQALHSEAEAPASDSLYADVTAEGESLDTLPSDILNLIANSNRLEAIRTYRILVNCGLPEAAKAIDILLDAWKMRQDSTKKTYAQRIAALEAQVQSDAAYIERLEKERTEAQEAIAGLHTQLKKAQGDLSAAQAIIIKAGQDFQALRNENAELRQALDRSAFKHVIIERILLDMVENSIYWPLDRFRRTAKSALHISPDDVQKEIDAFYIATSAHKADTPTPQAPDTPKRPVATHCKVNWNKRGFSSGDYEVLGYSQEKQVYILNISSDPNRPMPKAFRMADCAVVS